ncbi:unnamed protein product, partial [Closterium sp. NIES-53]
MNGPGQFIVLSDMLEQTPVTVTKEASHKATPGAAEVPASASAAAGADASVGEVAAAASHGHNKGRGNGSKGGGGGRKKGGRSNGHIRAEGVSKTARQAGEEVVEVVPRQQDEQPCTLRTDGFPVDKTGSPQLVGKPRELSTGPPLPAICFKRCEGMWTRLGRQQWAAGRIESAIRLFSSSSPSPSPSAQQEVGGLAKQAGRSRIVKAARGSSQDQVQPCVDSLTLADSLLSNVDLFFTVMEEISWGGFLTKSPARAHSFSTTINGSSSISGSSGTGSSSSSNNRGSSNGQGQYSWEELPWLQALGFYPLAAFVASRLEIHLWRAWDRARCLGVLVAAPTAGVVVEGRLPQVGGEGRLSQAGVGMHDRTGTGAAAAVAAATDSGSSGGSGGSGGSGNESRVAECLALSRVERVERWWREKQGAGGAEAKALQGAVCLAAKAEGGAVVEGEAGRWWRGGKGASGSPCALQSRL